MTFTVVPDKTVGDPFTEQMWDSYIKDNLNKGVVRPIADSIAGGSVASFDFQSIPADYAHLLLVVRARSDQAVSDSQQYFRINGDTGGNYNWEEARFTAAASNVSEAFAATQIVAGYMPGNTATTNRFSAVAILVPHYAGGGEKAVAILMAHPPTNSPGGMHVGIYGGVWRNTAAVTRVTFLSQSGNLVAGSRATLYGLTN